MQQVKDTNIIMEVEDMEDLTRLHDKCKSSLEYVSVKERVLPYLLIHKYQSDKQNGIDLTKMAKRSGLHELNHNEVFKDNCSTTYSGGELPMYDDNGTATIHSDTFSDCSHPPLNDDTLRKARLWALRILRLLSELLQYSPGQHRPGIRNFYLPGQEIHVHDKDLTIGLCEALWSLLQLPDET